MTTPTCPECSGRFLLGHEGGPLVVQHRVGCSGGASQDQTQAADVDRLSDPYGPYELDRESTSAERLLCDALGLAQPHLITLRRVTSTGSVTERRPRTA